MRWIIETLVIAGTVTIAGCELLAEVPPPDDSGTFGGAGGDKTSSGAVCGDGILEAPETCDDTGTTSGDGCSEDCQEEPGWRCFGAGLSSCSEIDECETMEDNCAADATCFNTFGAFYCVCNAGFSGDGTTCTPGCGDGVKSATENCDDNNFLAGDGCSPSCTIEPGWICMGEGPASCVDIDECAKGAYDCPANNVCVNTKGSYRCACKPGFSGDGVTCIAGCGDGVKNVAIEACDDGNTLWDDGCDPNCNIEPGWQCMGVGPFSCIDIDECTNGTAMCGVNETCHNMSPGFMCSCDTPQFACAGVCTKVLWDPNHCGTCDKVCDPGHLCDQGACK
ncbi:MAG: EGF domain-containing protein [Polyangiaceae bacterium]